MVGLVVIVGFKVKINQLLDYILLIFLVHTKTHAMLTLGVQRYVAVRHPLHLKVWITKRKTLKAMLLGNGLFPVHSRVNLCLFTTGE